jgi:hypothetical protein
MARFRQICIILPVALFLALRALTLQLERPIQEAHSALRDPWIFRMEVMTLFLIQTKQLR